MKRIGSDKKGYFEKGLAYIKKLEISVFFGSGFSRYLSLDFVVFEKLSLRILFKSKNRLKLD